MNENALRQRLRKQARPALLCLAITLLLFFAFPEASIATLIIAMRHNDDIYVASDGMLTIGQGTSVQVSSTNAKCFRISDTCCVALANFAGFESASGNEPNSEMGSISLYDELQRISSQEYERHESLTQSGVNVLYQFKDWYGKCVALGMRNEMPNEKQVETSLLFVGYDPELNGFVERLDQFLPSAHNGFQVRLTNNNSIPKGYMRLLGESSFLSNILGNFIVEHDPKLTALLPEEVRLSVSNLMCTEKQLDTPVVIDAILRLYALDRRYAKQYFPQEGHVGPPYLIYQITKTNVTRIYSGDGNVTFDHSILIFVVGLIAFILIILLLLLIVKRWGDRFVEPKPQG
jgi:hypothetical protein